jgi:hypothetical protein
MAADGGRPRMTRVSVTGGWIGRGRDRVVVVLAVVLERDVVLELGASYEPQLAVGALVYVTHDAQFRTGTFPSGCIGRRP